MVLTQGAGPPSTLPRTELAELKRIFDTSFVLQQGANDLLIAMDDDQVLDCDRDQLIVAAQFCGWIAADALWEAQLRLPSGDSGTSGTIGRPDCGGMFPTALMGCVPRMRDARVSSEKAVKLLANSRYDLCVSACARTRQLHAWSLASG